MTRTSRSLGLIALFLVAATSACGDVEPYAPHAMIRDPRQLFMRLTLNHRAINMSTAEPYNTLQLVATPRDGNGDPMSGLPPAKFKSLDSASVSVTPDGLLLARQDAVEVRIIAEIDAGNNTRHTDTAVVNVTSNPTPPTIAEFSIHPQPPDSAVWNSVPWSAFMPAFMMQAFAGIATVPSLKLRVLDAAGEPIYGMAVEYESLTPDLVTVDPSGSIASPPQVPGVAKIAVRTTAYGQTFADTAEFTILPPLVHGVYLKGFVADDNTEQFNPSVVAIRRNGWVFWINVSEDQLDIVFDDPAQANVVQPICDFLAGAFCDAGNIASFGSMDFFDFMWIRGRQFTTPGVYPYHNSQTGFSGKVIVLADGQALP